eukprot:SAG11_NODE_16_length_26235_cov_39.900417_4_plen_134_part_00
MAAAQENTSIALARRTGAYDSKKKTIPSPVMVLESKFEPMLPLVRPQLDKLVRRVARSGASRAKIFTERGEAEFGQENWRGAEQLLGRSAAHEPSRPPVQSCRVSCVRMSPCALVATVYAHNALDYIDVLTQI